MVLGVGIGLAVAAAVLSVSDGGGSVTHGPLLSDCDGVLHEVVIQYVPDAAPIVIGACRDFLTQLPADVTAWIVCPDREAFDDFGARIGSTSCTLRSVIVDHPITSWSRDRWLCLEPGPEGVSALLSPRGEMGAGVWPAREGDERVGEDLAAAPGPHVVAVRSGLLFDGGDVVADEETVFVTPRVLHRNLQKTVATRQELLDRLSKVLKRKVVLLEDAPDHHAGMFMMPVGGRTMLVGDPAAGRRLTGNADLDALCPPQGADFSEETQARFDAVAAQCSLAGYRVVRIPVVPGRDGRTYLTPLNAILDERDGRRIVYMPIYRGADVLNEAAASAWNSVGYDVRTVDCSDAYTHFGSLRCLVNVLRRGA